MKEATSSEAMFKVNKLWIMLATTFVFIMPLGFACVEAGFVQKKNVVNILFKHSIPPCIGLLTYAIMGFNLMYPGSDYAGGWFGFSGFGIASPDGDAGLIGYAGGKYTY